MLPGVTSDSIGQLMRLPARKRLAIAERSWLSVADEAAMPVPAVHERLLRQRLADYRSGKTKAIPHDELMRRLRTT